MNNQLALNTGFAQEKMYAALAKRPPVPQGPAENNQAIKQNVEQEQSLKWVKAEGSEGSDADFNLTFASTSELRSSTVLTPQAVKSTSQVFDLKQGLQEKFVELLEQTYANSFHYNRLVAKVAEWTMGNIMGRLALMGMSTKELAKIKRRIRKKMIEQNATALRQVMYDETMLEIVG
jgi:hypothetical protein